MNASHRSHRQHNSKSIIIICRVLPAATRKSSRPSTNSSAIARTSIVRLMISVRIAGTAGMMALIPGLCERRLAPTLASHINRICSARTKPITDRPYFRETAWWSRVSKLQSLSCPRTAQWFSRSRRWRRRMRRVVAIRCLLINFWRCAPPSLRNRRARGIHKWYSRAMCPARRLTVTWITTIDRRFSLNTASSHSKAGSENAKCSVRRIRYSTFQRAPSTRTFRLFRHAVRTSRQSKVPRTKSFRPTSKSQAISRRTRYRSRRMRVMMTNPYRFPFLKGSISSNKRSSKMSWAKTCAARAIAWRSVPWWLRDKIRFCRTRHNRWISHRQVRKVQLSRRRRSRCRRGHMLETCSHYSISRQRRSFKCA